MSFATPTIFRFTLAAMLLAGSANAQSSGSAYRAAAQAFRDAAAKAAPATRSCYLQWAVYYDAVATATAAGANIPAAPSDATCRAALGLGAPSMAAPSTSVGQKPPTQPSGAREYPHLIAVGYDFFMAGKLKEAYTAALMAAQTNPKGYESYALAAAVMHVQGEARYAKDFVDKAIARADADQRAKLRDLAAAITKGLALR